MSLLNIAGRKEQISIFEQALNSPDAEFIAVYGRRRVGKTFLIREFFDKRICFEIIGLYEGSLKEQLYNFSISLGKALGIGIDPAPPSSWQAAFTQLESFLELLKRKKSKEKRVIFMDELPWLNSSRSGFLSALQYFWNRYGSLQKNLILVVCGSAASWMIQHIVHSKGGLHNRLTRQIRLLPFTLAETKEYLEMRNIKNLGNFQLIQLYMAVGGVPYYLKFVKSGMSASQLTADLLFKNTAPLRDEYNILFESLFTNSDQHRKIIELLSASWKGASRNEIIEKTGIKSGGTISLVLDELMESGFIESYVPFGKNINAQYYRLWDEYSMFYLKWLKPLGKRSADPEYWMAKQSSQSFKSWAGFSFENICMKHVHKIKEKLGISGVETQVSTWRHQSTKNSSLPGTQIDLLIDRKDGIINLCEMKFYDAEFTITANYAKELRQKIAVFRQVTGTRKSIFLVLITPYGLIENKYSLELEVKNLRIDDLF